MRSIVLYSALFVAAYAAVTVKLLPVHASIPQRHFTKIGLKKEAITKFTTKFNKCPKNACEVTACKDLVSAQAAAAKANVQKECDVMIIARDFSRDVITEINKQVKGTLKDSQLKLINKKYKELDTKSKGNATAYTQDVFTFIGKQIQGVAAAKVAPIMGGIQKFVEGNKQYQAAMGYFMY